MNRHVVSYDMYLTDSTLVRVFLSSSFSFARHAYPPAVMRKTSGRDKLCAFIQGMAKYYGATVEIDTERHLISQAM